jgi:phosphoribosylcarboxyaminoimidazole (NCAIR) mutase
MSIGPWGARNAGLLAVQIIARRVPQLRAALARHKRKMAADVDKKAKAILEDLKGRR